MLFNLNSNIEIHKLPLRQEIRDLFADLNSNIEIHKFVDAVKIMKIVLI